MCDIVCIYILPIILSVADSFIVPHSIALLTLSSCCHAVLLLVMLYCLSCCCCRVAVLLMCEQVVWCPAGGSDQRYLNDLEGAFLTYIEEMPVDIANLLQL